MSGEVPQEPVVSPVSGAVFEKRLIEKYLNTNSNTDPVNGETLTVEQLINIKGEQGVCVCVYDKCACVCVYDKCVCVTSVCITKHTHILQCPKL